MRRRSFQGQILNRAYEDHSSHPDTQAFQHRLSMQEVVVAVPRACASGGLSKCQKIADGVERSRIRCKPHVWGIGVAIAGGLRAGCGSNPLTCRFRSSADIEARLH